MSKHRLTKGSVRRSLALSAAGAMIFALTPMQGALAQTEPERRDIAEQGDVCENAEGDAFDDINNNETDRAADCLNDLMIARGYGDNTYRPGEAVSREQMASFISRKLQSAVEYDRQDDAPEANFGDREQIAQVHINNVDIIADLGITQGDEHGDFHPGNPVSRGQMASFIVRQLETMTGQTFSTQNDYFDDDNGTAHEDNINVVAEFGIAQGDAQGDFNPNSPVLRGQMALFIARDIDYAHNEQGFTFEPATDEAPAATNQTFNVTPAEDATQGENTSRTFTFSGITSDTVDIQLAGCDDVTTNADGNVVFRDADNDNDADFRAVAAHISAVNGVARTDNPDRINDADSADGDVQATVQSTGADCVVVVVFDDADDDNLLDLDANDMPTEDFGVSPETRFQTVRGLDAEPETDVNRFGTDHTVTAQLINNANEDTGTAVSIAGETVRFQIVREGTPTARTLEGGGTDADNEVCTGGTVIATGTTTTDANGQATVTYTGPNDPNPNATGTEQDINDCIVLFYDRNDNGILDADEESDAVAKTWSDVEAPLALNAEPEVDSNPVNTNHTVTATVTNRFGEASPNEQVVFEVYRDRDEAEGTTLIAPVLRQTRTADANGVATLTYTGPANPADDEIVVCVDENADGDCETTLVAATTGTGFVLSSAETANDVVEKYWVRAAAAEETAAGEVAGFDVADDNVDVDAATNLRFVYDANDRFVVACTNGAVTDVTLQQFEAALEIGDGIDVTAENPATGIRTFTLEDADDDSAFC